MLSPLAYERDCNEIVSTLVDHKILVGEEREAGLQKAKLLWHQLYGSEPFEVDLTSPIGNEMPRVSRIQYDIVAACSRQRVFNYQVSLPHYGDKRFLRDALERYKRHLRFNNNIRMRFSSRVTTLTLSGMRIKSIRWATGRTP